MPELSNYTDDELRQAAGVKPVVSSMSDDDLMKIANQPDASSTPLISGKDIEERFNLVRQFAGPELEKKARNAASIAATFDVSEGTAFDMHDSFLQKMDTTNLWDKATGSFKAGWGDMYSSIGGIMKRKGIAPEWADNYVDFGERLKRAYIPPSDQSEFTWRKMKDPEWYATTIMRSVPFTLSLVPAAIVGAYGGAAVAGVAGLGVFGKTVLGAIGGAALSRPVESAFEAQGAYEEAKQKKFTDEDAEVAANQVYWDNMKLVGLDAAEFATAFMPMGKIAGSTVKRVMGKRVLAATGKLGAVGAMEMGEERYQESAVMNATGQDVSFFDFSNPRLNEAGAAGAVFGVGLGGAGSVWTALHSNVTDTMTGKSKFIYEKAKETAIAQGAEGTAAELQALDAVASTAEGKAHIESVVSDLKDLAEGKPAKEKATVGTEEKGTGQPFIIGVNEDANGVVTGFTMADPVSGQTFEVGAYREEGWGDVTRTTPDMAAVNQKIQKLRKEQPDETDAQLDQLIQGNEDIDQVAGKMFGETEQIDDVPDFEDDAKPETIISRVKSINDSIGEKGSVDLTPLVDLGRSIWAEGHQSIESFTARAKELLSDVWDKVKDLVSQAWVKLKEERGSISAKMKYDLDEVNGLLDMAGRQDKAQGVLPEQPSYDQVRAKAAEMAFEKLQKKIDFQKRKEAAALKNQGKADARSLPAFQAMDYISKNGSLNKSKLLKDYDTESIKELSKRRINLVKENGTLELDVVADQLGFESADDLYNALMDWQGLEEEGKRASSDFMGKFGDLITTAEMDNFNELLIAEEDKIMKSLTEANRPKPAKGLKNVIRKQTGQAKPKDKTVTEYEALTGQLATEEKAAKVAERKRAHELKQAFIEAARMAQDAYKAGKTEEVVKSKEQMRWMIKRRNTLKNVRDYFKLTDSEMSSITRKNPLLMDDAEFSQYLKDVQNQAVLLADNKQAKIELMMLIENRRLQKVDNYRKAMQLPSINEMTTEQLREFAKLLEPFQDDDVFLTQRELETVDRTDVLKGTKTWREAREAMVREIQTRHPEVELKDLAGVKVAWNANWKWDSSLREQDPFFELLVHDMGTANISADMKVQEVETKVFELAKKAEKSRKRTLSEKLIPQDKQIFDWLEAPAVEKEAIAHQMTGDQLNYAHFMIQYFADALDYLMSIKAVEKGRENYISHVRKTFMENVRDKGLTKATSEMFAQMEEDQMTFNILDDDTGNILPLEKFFQFQMHRNGGLDPTTNVTRAFMTYVRTFERKKMYDAIIPKLDIYTQSLTPTLYTPRGLEVDASLKKFVNTWINNKKGRHISFNSVIRQGGPLDVMLRASKTFTSMLDLGFFAVAQGINIVGEQMGTMVPLGVKDYAKSIALIRTPKGKRILDKYEAFTGRSFWENFTAPGKQANERLMAAMFGIFHVSTVAANKQFLLASMSDQEWANETLTDERLAEIKLEMGRFRAVPGDSSIIGSTSLGASVGQYKTWAISPTRTLIDDIAKIVKGIKNNKPGEALTSKEAREVYRVVGVTASMAILIAMAGAEDDDRSTLGKMKTRATREVFSMTAGTDPAFWLSWRTASWLKQLGTAMKNLLFLETYKTKDELKGVQQAKKALIPGAIRNLGDDKED